MREIEFRGKRIDKNVRQENGEWEFGSINIHPLGCEIAKGHALIPVDPETVGQYTGLKDKNGVKIFEGDVVQTSELSLEKALTVIYSSTSFYIKSPRVFCLLQSYRNIQVIGSIHDNPELIKTEAQ